MSVTVAAISDAVIGPTPGIVASLRAVSSRRACEVMALSSAAASSSSARNRPCSARSAWRAASGRAAASCASATSISCPSWRSPRGAVRPNSAARPRTASASIVCCLTSSARAVCSASTPCRSTVFTGTNFTSGRRAASQIAAASAASFLRPLFTNGRAASGGTSFTSCPSAPSTRPQWCAAPHASSTTVHGGCAAKNATTPSRCSLRLSTALPVSSTPCTWKVALAVSRPIMLMLLIAGGSLMRTLSRPQPWHIDVVAGRPPHLLGLELDDPGFDHSVLCEFRSRLLEGGAEERLLSKLLEACRARGLLEARGRQRTDSTRVLASIRALNRLELVGETLRAALNELATAAPDWLRAEAEREAYARAVGEDGFALLDLLDRPEAP